MTHWEVSNLLTDYSEGALDRARAAQMEEHLASCEECRAMLEDVQFALRTLRAAEDVEPSPGWFDAFSGPRSASANPNGGSGYQAGCSGRFGRRWSIPFQWLCFRFHLSCIPLA